MIAESVAFLVARRASACCSTPSTSSTAIAPTPATRSTACARPPTPGAERVVLCDTNGGSLPPQIARRAAAVVRERCPACALGIHCHDDAGCARRQLAGRRRGRRDAGAGHDERHRRAHRQREPRHDHRQPAAEDGLRAARARAARAADRDGALRRRAAQPHARPGASRTSASTRSRTRPACTPPASAPTRRPSSTSTRRSSATAATCWSPSSPGAGTVVEKAAEAGHRARRRDGRQRVLERVKELEHEGYQFEAADGSFELLLRKEAGELRAAVPPRVLARDRRAARRRQGRDRGDDQDLASTASATCAPPRATARSTRSTRRCATRSARSTRTSRDIELVNFKVRILDETKGTGAVTRVLIDASDGHDVWGSIGVSENVIAASWEALVDSLEYGDAAGRGRAAERAIARPAARARRERSRSPGRCSARRRSGRSLEVLRSGQLSLGPARGGVRAGASRRASGAPHASAVSSGTAGLHLALRAVGVQRRRRGRHEPVLVRRLRQRGRSTSARGRCSPTSTRVTLNLDPQAAAAAVTERTTALLPVHIFGYPADMPAFERSRARPADRRGRLRGARRASTPTASPVGARGHPAVFGFYANKQLTTGEGGMVTIGDAGAEGADRLRAQPGPRAGHGLARPRPARLQLPPVGHRLRARARAARAPRRDARRRARASPRSTARRWPAIEGLDAAVRGRGRRPRAAGSCSSSSCRAASTATTTIRALRGARRPEQALPAGDPPDELLPRALRPPRGRVPGLRGRRRALARAAVLPGDDRGPGRARRRRPLRGRRSRRAT